MHELAQAIPDVDALLALAPEELGAKLLFLMRKRVAVPFQLDSSLNLNNAGLELQRAGNYGAQWRDVSLALAEAWCWLEVQGLLVPDEGTNGASGFRRLSRRAQAFESEADLKPYALVRRLPKEALHPALASKVWAALMRGELDTAVFQAMKAVEVAVRDASGVNKNGVALMRDAFHPEKGPLTDANAEASEREGQASLFTGAIAALRNPHAHRNVNLDDAAEAIEIIMVANHLLRIVDTRKVALPRPDPATSKQPGSLAPDGQPLTRL